MGVENTPEDSSDAAARADVLQFPTPALSDVHARLRKSMFAAHRILSMLREAIAHAAAHDDFNQKQSHVHLERLRALKQDLFDAMVHARNVEASINESTVTREVVAAQAQLVEKMNAVSVGLGNIDLSGIPNIKLIRIAEALDNIHNPSHK